MGSLCSDKQLLQPKTEKIFNLNLCNTLLSASKSLLTLFCPNRGVPRNKSSTALADSKFLFHFIFIKHLSCVYFLSQDLKKMMMNVESNELFSGPTAHERLQFSGSSSHTSYQLHDLPEGVREPEFHS